MKKKILLIVLTLIAPSFVYASTNITCTRTEDNNYGANKNDVTFNSSNLYKVDKIPCVDATEYVYDFGDVLTDEQEENIAKVMKEFEEKYHIAIMYYSFDYAYVYGQERQVDDFAHDFYDLNDFGIDYDTYTGVYLFENAYKLGYDNDYDGVDDGFYFNAGSKGSAQLYYYSERLDNSLDDIYYELKYGDKEKAIIKWVESIESYYKKGQLQDYTIDEFGNLIYTPKFHPAFVLYSLVAGIITIVVVSVYVGKNKMVKKAVNADEYLVKSSINYSVRNDQFISTHTTSYHISSSSGGSGGGGGFHSSGGSFSGGHSSGGGRH